jgi:uncharacterized protein
LGLPTFRPRPPWWGPDLQTLRNLLSPQRIDLTPWPETSLWFEAANGADALSGRLQRPKTGPARPLVILLHGLTGSAEGHTLRASASTLLQAGFPVLRLNLRGAGETAERCATQYHTGLTADQHAVLDQLPSDLRADGVVLFGYSLGGNTVVKFLCDGARPGLVVAGIAVCPPIDPAAAVKALETPRNWVYQRHLLRSMKSGALASRMAPKWLELAKNSVSIYQYDNDVTAPLHGFYSADDFYDKVSTKSKLSHIKTDLLIIHSRDDPWIPVDAFVVDRDKDLASVNLLLTDDGGHCGFHSADDPVPWHDRAAANYLLRLSSGFGLR